MAVLQIKSGLFYRFIIDKHVKMGYIIANFYICDFYDKGVRTELSGDSPLRKDCFGTFLFGLVQIWDESFMDEEEIYNGN